MKDITKRYKKNLRFLAFGLFIVGIFLGWLIWGINRSGLPTLPKPELADGIRGSQFYIDKNINEETIDNYLDRDDTVYRFLLMLEDTATWENKGGSRYLTGFIRGFEVVPYPYLSGFSKEYREIKESENVSGLYEGDTLFTLNEDGTYTANYAESMEILEYLFPKDKYIFLMCGGGGYAGIAKKMLVALGWDENKVYNVGAYWKYEGKNNVPVERTLANGTKQYDFWKVAYHNIDFSRLTKL